LGLQTVAQRIQTFSQNIEKFLESLFPRVIGEGLLTPSLRNALALILMRQIPPNLLDAIAQ
jgi:hypothetical protein